MKSYKEMTVKELKELADSLNIEYKKSITKKDLIDLLKNYQLETISEDIAITEKEKEILKDKEPIPAPFKTEKDFIEENIEEFGVINGKVYKKLGNGKGMFTHNGHVFDL